MTSRNVLAAAAVVALLCLGGCGNAAVPVTGAPVPANTRAAGGPTDQASSGPNGTTVSTGPTSSTEVKPAPTTITAGGKQIQAWPTGVTLPSDVVVSMTNVDERGGIVTFTKPLPSVLIAQLRDDFVKAGFTMTLDTGTSFHFDGPGWTGIVTSGGTATTINWSVGEELLELSNDDLGLSVGVPSLLGYPKGTKATNVQQSRSGSAYDLEGVSPAVLLGWYRANLEPMFDLDSDLTANGATTLSFSDGSYSSTLTCTASTCRMQHKAK